MTHMSSLGENSKSRLSRVITTMAIEAAIVSGCAGLPGEPAHIATDPETNFEPAPRIAAESDRRKLPNNLRSRIPDTVANSIELNELVTLSPPSTAGFIARFRSRDQNGTSEYSYTIDCMPLPSGFLSCSRKIRLKDGSLHCLEQSLFAYGGLVKIGYTKFDIKELTPIVFHAPYGISERKESGKAALPNPGFDFIYRLYSTSGTEEKMHERCKSYEGAMQIPAALERYAPVTLISCANATYDPANTQKLEANSLYLDQGSLYFWISSKGIAIPAVLVSTSPLPRGFSGYFGIWTDLRDERFPQSGPQLLIDEFRIK